MQTKFVRELNNKYASLRANSPFREYREKSRTHFGTGAMRKEKPFAPSSFFRVLVRLAAHGQME